MTNKQIESIRGKLKYDQILEAFLKTKEDLDLSDVVSVLYLNEKNFLKDLKEMEKEHEESGSYDHGWSNPKYYKAKEQLRRDYSVRDHIEWFKDINIKESLDNVRSSSIETLKRIQDILENDNGKIAKIDAGEWILINTSKVQFTNKGGNKMFHIWQWTSYKYFKNLTKKIDKYINIQDGNLRLQSSEKKMKIEGKKRNNRFSKLFNKNLKKIIEEKYIEHLI